jgi:ribosomal-protein-alanine N-acetyltransferase
MTVALKIGHATRLDILAHLRECDASFQPTLSSRVDLARYAEKIHQQAVTFEAWHGSRLVGLVASYLNNERNQTGYITSVSTAPDWMGRGTARALMEMALGYAGSRGFMAVDLEVGENNLPAMALYHRLGFEVQGHADGMVKMTWMQARHQSQTGRSE